MKVAISNKKKTWIFIALLVVAALRFYWDVRTPTVVVPVAGKPAKATTKAPPHPDRHYIGYLLKPTLDPHLRVDLAAGSESFTYEGSGRDIFAEDADDIPKPVASVLVAKPADPLPPLPPPPPINLKFWGWASRPGESKAVFLAQGDNGFIAHEGEIIARRYRVVKIGPSSVEIEDLLNNNQQSIQVTF